jgi:hypothetical protein
MSKVVAALVLSVLSGLAALVVTVASAGCGTPATSTLTDCASFYPDAGTSDTLTCAIAWSCNSGATQLQLTCTQDPQRSDAYDCSCSNGTTTTQSIVVPTFMCDPNFSLNTANMGCNFNIAY